MLRLKVCGIREEDNYNHLVALHPEFVGLNFYSRSPRYVKDQKIKKKPGIALTGVFVNEAISEIQQKVQEYQLDFVQLHGDESSQVCQELNDLKIEVIKAFRITDSFDFDLLSPYLSCCRYFLFDTPGVEEQYGGTGKRFAWEILKFYPFNKPFFLAGGISSENVKDIFQLGIPQLFGVDINSRFEISPGIKDIEEIKKFKEILNNHG